MAMGAVGLIRTRGRPLAAGVASASLAVGVVVAAAGGSGTMSRQVGSGAGSAWFASESTGHVSLIDGPTATRIERVPGAGAPDDEFSVSTVRSDGWIVNRSQSQVRRVDGASLTLQQPLASTTVDDGFELVANTAAVWEIVQGRSAVLEVDEHSGMAMGQLLPAPGAVQSAAIAPDGTLWTTDQTSSEVSSYRDGELRSRREVRGGQGADIVIAGDQPVVVPRTGEPALALDDDGATELTLCDDITGGAGVLLAGSEPGDDWVLAVNPTAGILTVADLDSQQCPSIALGVASDSPRYGRPVAHGDRVFVADTVAGTAIVVDPSKSDPIVARLDLDLPGRPFVLFGVNGFVWFDEPRGDTAGVITDDLQVKIVSKAQGDGTPRDPTPDEGPDDQPQQRKEPECHATPAQVVVDQAVELFVIKNDYDVSADAWTWTVNGAEFANGSTGVQIGASFPVAGTYNASAKATTTDGEPVGCDTTITVVAVDVPTTTSTAPPTTIDQLPATTVPADTVPATTSDQPDTAVPPTAPATTLVATTSPPTTTSPPPTTATQTVPTTTTPTTPPTTVPTTPPTTVAAPTTTLAVPQPDFTFQPANPRAGEVVTFTDLTPGGPFTNIWTFEGANPPTGTGTNPTTTWSSPGTYMVTLVADNSGVSQPISKPVTVGFAPALNQVTLTSVTPMGPVDCSSGMVPFVFAWSVDAVGPLQLSITFERDDGSTTPPAALDVPNGPQVIAVNDTWNVTVPGSTGTLTGSNEIVVSASGSELFRGATGSITASCFLPLVSYEAVRAGATLNPGPAQDVVADCPSGKVVVAGGTLPYGVGTILGGLVETSGAGDPNARWRMRLFPGADILLARVWAMCASAPPGYQIVTKDTAVDSSGFYRDVVSCPAGKVATGGGTLSSADVSFWAESSSDVNTADGSAWMVATKNPTPAVADTVHVTVICIDRPAGFEVNRTDVAVGPGMQKFQSLACANGGVMLGAGAQVVNEAPRDFLTKLGGAAPDFVSSPDPSRPIAAADWLENNDSASHTFAATLVCSYG
jgi:hypothetical protein